MRECLVGRRGTTESGELAVIEEAGGRLLSTSLYTRWTARRCRALSRGARRARAITSLQNERVKLIRSLEMRKVRRETGLFVAEGASVLVTARDAGWKPQNARASSPAARRRHPRASCSTGRQAAGAECLEVSEAVLGKLAAKDNPQTMLGVFEQRWAAEPDAASVPADALWVVLEALRDPGNLGTIVRTADAVGASGVALVGASVDPYSREAVRASMGSIFNVPLVRLRAGALRGVGCDAGRATSSARTSAHARTSAPCAIARRRSC